VPSGCISAQSSGAGVVVKGFYLGHQYVPHCWWRTRLADEALATDLTAAKTVVQDPVVVPAPLPDPASVADDLRVLQEPEETAAAVDGGADFEEDFDLVEPFSFGIWTPRCFVRQI
jgi:hypothetical protein